MVHRGDRNGKLILMEGASNSRRCGGRRQFFDMVLSLGALSRHRPHPATFRPHITAIFGAAPESIFVDRRIEDLFLAPHMCQRACLFSGAAGVSVSRLSLTGVSRRAASRLVVANGRVLTRGKCVGSFIQNPARPSPRRPPPWTAPRYSAVRPGMCIPSECFGGAQRIVCVCVQVVHCGAGGA